MIKSPSGYPVAQVTALSSAIQSSLTVPALVKNGFNRLPRVGAELLI